MKNNFTTNEIEECLLLAKKTYYNVNNKEKFEICNSLVLPFHPSLEDIVYPLKKNQTLKSCFPTAKQ